MLHTPKNIYAELFAVKAVLNSNNEFFLADVGIRGVTRMLIVDGYAFFTAVKFSTTSYNNEGVKFHLVLSIYVADNKESKHSDAKVLISVLSPPIFVDSRK